MPDFTCSECGKALKPEEVLEHDCNIAKAMVVPDVVGEIDGWRAWLVRGEGDSLRLGSVTHQTFVWTPRSFMIAHCVMHKPEEIPHEKHGCGLYAAKTREHLLSMSYHRYDAETDIVIGEVAMSGRVIPGTQGWRAQKARIKKVYVPYERWQLVNQIKEVYGVEVELSNTLVVPQTAPF